MPNVAAVRCWAASGMAVKASLGPVEQKSKALAIAHLCCQDAYREHKYPRDIVQQQNESRLARYHNSGDEHDS